eukprot:Sspe_Gene.89456::Locus_61224_Transcript_1_1_Confidence_1.000_Length_922::g.89456::m.89456/K14025/SELS, VIMP; selenoprotein S
MDEGDVANNLRAYERVDTFLVSNWHFILLAVGVVYFLVKGLSIPDRMRAALEKRASEKERGAELPVDVLRERMMAARQRQQEEALEAQKAYMEAEKENKKKKVNEMEKLERRIQGKYDDDEDRPRPRPRPPPYRLAGQGDSGCGWRPSGFQRKGG